MFMAILNDTYSEVKEDVENRNDGFQVDAHFFPSFYKTFPNLYIGRLLST